MTYRAFRSMMIAVLTVLAVTVLLILTVSYSYFTELQQDRLLAETELAAQGTEQMGLSYLENLDVGEERVTWVNSDGTVLYDNQSEDTSLENHLEREEIQEALKNGTGVSARYSDTLSERLLYAAVRLKDGSVLRLSVAQYTVWVLLCGMMQPIAVVVFLAMILSFFLADSLSKKIVRPLNQLDLDHPLRLKCDEELRPMLTRIANQQEKLQQADRLRQEFTANVSHELKTPVHTVCGYAELLKNGMAAPEDVGAISEKIYQESQHLGQLVDDILALSHLDEGAEDMQWEDTDLYDVTASVVRRLTPQADAAHVTLQMDGTSLPMRGIPKLLDSIVTNLCDNGIKYNRIGGKVTVSVREQDGKPVLTVSDTGIGIPEEEQERIFERFYRVDKGRSRSLGGTGLGLSIVKHAVMVHGGKISVSSSPEMGSTFTVTFPEN